MFLQKGKFKRIDDGTSEGDFPDSPEALHRPIYFQLIDLLQSELEEWFASNNHEALISIETLLLNSIVKSEPSAECITKVTNFYGNHLDPAKLKVELSIFYHQIKNETLPKKDIEGIREVYRMNNYASLYPEIYSLFKLYLVVPIASVGAERSFSTLRRVKTWMRSTMSEDRLCSIALMCIEREIAKHFVGNIEELVSQFANSSSRLALR